MRNFLKLLADLLVSMAKSRARLEAENVVLRHPLNVLRRTALRRTKLTNLDRLIFVWLYRLFPGVLTAVAVVRPETIVRWHRRGFRLYWRSKSSFRGGRPRISADIRRLIRDINIANPLRGTPRIHGEPLKLGFEIGQTTAAKYMARAWRPSSQTWKTFLRNHAAGIAAIDLCVVPTIAFGMLYALIVLGHDRRRLLSFGVTARPTVEWIARQITEAFPWDNAPRYLIRGRDAASGELVVQWLRAMGIRDRPGRMRTRRGSSAQFEESAWAILLSTARPTFAGSSDLMPPIITRSGRTHPWARTRRSVARFRPSAASLRSRSSEGFIISTVGSSF